MRTIPHFDSERLVILTKAFQSRSRAITYHAPDWTITRDEVESEFERLNVDADGHHGKLRISIWADGVLWFRLCRGRARNGWAFMLTFSGDCSMLAAEAIVECFVLSMKSEPDTLLTLWKGSSPVVERLDSSE